MNNIKKARLLTGMTRKAVSEKLNVPYRTLENWENGTNYPSLYMEKMIIREIERINVKNTITNNHGIVIDFEVAVTLMSSSIRDELHKTITPCTEQEFFNAYCKKYEEEFGEEFELAKENPIYDIRCKK